MAQSTSVGKHSNVTAALAQDRLGVPSLYFFAVTAAAPLTVVIGLVPVGFAVAQAKSIPFAFLSVAVVLAIFSIGYVAMARHISNAGAFYAYVTQGLGRPLGVGTSFIALLAYNALQIPLYGGFGYFGSILLATKFNWNVQWWVVALAIWAIVGILGILRVDLNGKVLAVLLCLEIAILLVLDFADITQPAASGVVFDTLAPDNIIGASFGAAVVIAITGFSGFESAAVYGEETKNPRRTVAIATFLGLVTIGILYAGSSWAMSVATGPDKIVDAAGASLDPTAQPLVLALAGERLPESVVDIAFALFCTSMFAAAISFHNTVARYTFALGRERVLPAFLGRTGIRTGSPVAASLLQTVLGLASIVLWAVMGWEPLTTLFFYGGTLGGFALLTLVALVSLAVIGFFARDARGEGVISRVIAPLIAFAAVSFLIYRAVQNFDTLLAVAPDSPLRWVLPLLPPTVLLIGVLLALIIKAARPDIYSTIGLGPNSVTGRATSSMSIPQQMHASPTDPHSAYPLR
jgi:amino acid transporter